MYYLEALAVSPRSLTNDADACFNLHAPNLRVVRESLRQNSVCGVKWDPNSFGITLHLSLMFGLCKAWASNDSETIVIP